MLMGGNDTGVQAAHTNATTKSGQLAEAFRIGGAEHKATVS